MYVPDPSQVYVPDPSQMYVSDPSQVYVSDPSQVHDHAVPDLSPITSLCTAEPMHIGSPSNLALCPPNLRAT